MGIEILDCLKRERDICVKTIKTSQNTDFMLTPALSKAGYLRRVRSEYYAAITHLKGWRSDARAVRALDFNTVTLGLKGHCHAIWQLYKNLEGVFASTEFQN